MARFSTGIRCETLVSMRGGRAIPERDIFVGISGEKITAVQPWQPNLAAECAHFIEAKTKVVLPGFVNTHTHLAMTLFRGLEDDVPFHVWLFERILPLENDLVNADFVDVGSSLALLESIRFGVTTVNEMYFYCERVAEVLDRMGVRGYVSQTWSSFPLPEDKDLGRDKKKIFMRLWEKFGNRGRVRASLAPHAPYSCDDGILSEVAKLADETGAPIHIHVSETKKEVEDSYTQFNRSPVRRLLDLGVLRKGTICAHSIHLNEEDIQLLKNSGAGVAYNPDSNAKLGSGTAPIARYLSLNIPVAFGTDGTASNNDLSIFGAMDLGTKLQKLAGSNNTAMIAEQALVAATLGGAKVLGLENEIGSIEVGKQADLILVDLEFPHMQPVHSIVSQLVYAANGLEVDTVFCAGRILLKDKKHVGFDVSSIYARANEWRDRIQARMKEF